MSGGTPSLLRACFCARAVALAVAFCLGAVLPARAADYSVTAALGLETTGAFRGVKSRKLNPSVYGYLEIAYGEGLFGVFSNPVSIAGETNALVLGYALWKPTLGKFDVEAGARYYSFPDSSDFTFDFDDDGVVDHRGHKGLFEAQAGVRRKFEGGRVHIRAFYTPDGFAETGPAWYVSNELRADLPFGVEARGAVGVSRFSDKRFNENYIDYDAGLYKSMFGFDMFLRYSDTAGLSGPDNSVVVFGIERALSLASSAAREDRRYDKIRNDWRIDKARLGVIDRPAGD
ncbi:MAG: TorF family putative porin [Parvularculaceae bacterium]|nr:TorF family putative porin [Parvularculaceae bacterium]